MSIRIRVYPQRYGAYGLGAMGAGGVGIAALYNSKLQAQKQISGLQLGYERALANERIRNATMAATLQTNPYMMGGLGIGAAGFGALGTPLLSGMPTLMNQGMPGIIGGAGQTNITNQTSTGGAAQSVTNSNVANDSTQLVPPSPIMGGFPGFGMPIAQGWGCPPMNRFGGGGFLSGLLGALI